jgi:predicted Zn-dependent protease
MSVRWRPLILLTALFVAVAAVGLLAIASVLLPGRAEDMVRLAQAETRAKKFDHAKIQYARALQSAPRDARIHLALASMLAEWSDHEPAMRPKLRGDWLGALHNAAKHGKQMPEPRRLLMSDALASGEWMDAIRWAQELQPLTPDDFDARYVLAVSALEQHPPDLAGARKHLSLIEEREPRRPRTLWARALAAEVAEDRAALEAVLDSFRSAPAEPGGDATDRMARIHLRSLDLRRADDPAALATRIDAFAAEVNELSRIETETAPARAREVSHAIEQAHRHLNKVSAAHASGRAVLAPRGEALAQAADATFRRTVESAPDGDLRPYQGYAEYLLYIERHSRCLEVVGQALKLPTAAAAVWVPTAMELREIGIKAALADDSDAARFDKAAPMIRELLASGNERYQALGHLFQGVIELEQSGLADAGLSGAAGTAPRPAEATKAASALGHLRAAAEGLKDVATAQALYGVALILAREPALGRQYLQVAQRLGGGQLDPRYQLWAAWSVLQAGYPEEAQPTVDRLMAQVDRGEIGPDLRPTLHMLKAEIHQARRTPEGLRGARAEFQKALDAGQPRTPALTMRLAHLDGMLGNNPAQAIQVIDEASRSDAAGPSAEQLAVLTLREHGRRDEAARRLEAARRTYPDNADLAGLDAALRLDAGKPDEAEALLAAFLKDHPGHDELIVLRSKILAGPLKRPEEARAPLLALADTAKTSTPLVHLALLDLGRRDFAAAEKTIAQIRKRWPDAAAADLLDAQRVLAGGDTKAGAKFLAAALQKDPNNKVALFWKARLDELGGSADEARQVFERLLSERPVKEIDDGLPLAVAAQWALATMALERQEFDAAIAGFEALLKDGQAADLARPARWNLALARAARGDVAAARAEVDQLLRDPKTTPEERVQAADFFRTHGDPAAASKQLDIVLASTPHHSGAVTYRALMLMGEGRAAEAVPLVRAALAADKAPAGLYLMLAALENLAKDPDAPARARTALDEGLVAYPDHADLLRARYQVMTQANDPEAVAFIEARAKANPDGPASALLVEVYRDRRQFGEAVAQVEARLAKVGAASAEAARLSARRIELLIGQATDVGPRDPSAAQELLRKAATRAAEARKAFPDDARFVEMDGDLALRTGDLQRAGRLAQELSDAQRGSTAGPLLAARVAAASGRPDEAARAYEEALRRSPARADVRLALSRAQLAAGRADDAVRQASAVLDVQRDDVQARVLKARALLAQPGEPPALEARRREAATLLEAAIQASPKYGEAYHLLSDLCTLRGDRAQAIALLRQCLDAVPGDDGALSLLVQRLAEPPAPGGAADPAQTAEAEKVAQARAGGDETGTACLSVAVGYHRAGRPELARPWAERAAAKLDRPIVHLTLGDIYLAEAETLHPAPAAEPLFQKAVARYEHVARQQPDSVEAINNKAWILHRYLDRNTEASEIAEALVRRTAPGSLPPDFYDTLGAIRESAGNRPGAEEAFTLGLRQAPEHPILNYHMGRLLAADPASAVRARPYLDKALQARAALPGAMAEDLDRVVARLSR